MERWQALVAAGMMSALVLLTVVGLGLSTLTPTYMGAASEPPPQEMVAPAYEGMEYEEEYEEYEEEEYEEEYEEEHEEEHEEYEEEEHGEEE